MKNYYAGHHVDGKLNVCCVSCALNKTKKGKIDVSSDAISPVN
jgi:hypothetical protein